MNNPLAKLGVDSYPSLIVPIDLKRDALLQVNAVLQTDSNRDLVRVYWTISIDHERYVFTKNKTWVEYRRHKTDKFREKISFDSFDDAVLFLSTHWDKAIKPFKLP